MQTFSTSAGMLVSSALNNRTRRTRSSVGMMTSSTLAQGVNALGKKPLSPSSAHSDPITSPVMSTALASAARCLMVSHGVMSHDTC